MREIIMDSKVKILVGVLVVGILLISGWWILSNQMIGVCSNDTPQFCDRSCKTDQECKFACGCGCISRDEKCSSNAVCKIGVCHTCRCVNGKCESWFNVFKRALDTKDVALCGEIKPISCKDMCYKILAIDTKNITLCDKISNVYERATCRDVIKQEQVTITTDKTEYEQGEKINIIVKNNIHDKIFHCGAGDLSGWRWNLKKKENGIWKEIDGREFFPTVWTPPLRELAPNETFSVTVKKEVIEKTISPGTYKIGFKFFLTLDQSLEDVRENCWEREPNIIYSNEFTIK